MASKLTRAELIELISEKFPLKKTEANLLLEMVFKAIKQALADKRAVELRGFGAVSVRPRGERTGRNPRTGDQVPVPERRVVTFRPGKRMKELVSGTSPDEDETALDSLGQDTPQVPF